MDTTISAKLRHLAAQLTGGAPVGEVAAVLEELAARSLVALPVIDPDRDDTGHWQALSVQRLRSENHCDAWNLAAGIHEQARRTAKQTAARAHVDQTLAMLRRGPS